MEIDPNIPFGNPLPSNQRVEPSRCVDLIVLGINYRSNEEDVRNYFQQFGELVFCEVRSIDFRQREIHLNFHFYSKIKRDAQGQSRGFGFVRFKDYESQLNALNKRHHIDGRTCDLKIPDSKVSRRLDVFLQFSFNDVLFIELNRILVCTNQNVREKYLLRVCQVSFIQFFIVLLWWKVIFLLRLEIVTAEDLNQYFKRFGEVTDVYIPRPSRSFAFVTFLESSIVPSLYGDHFING